MINMINRRQFLKITGTGAAALASGGVTSLVEATGVNPKLKSAKKL